MSEHIEDEDHAKSKGAKLDYEKQAGVHLVLLVMELSNCQAQVQSQIRVPGPGPKCKSQILNPKSRGKELGLGLTL